MALYGMIGLMLAFGGILASIGCLCFGRVTASKNHDFATTLNLVGHWSAIAVAVALTFCCALLVWCFMTGDSSLLYVVQNRSGSSGGFSWLYKMSGLWAGRQGSLLFWAWLIALFNAAIALRTVKKPNELDNVAQIVSQAVLGIFVGILLFTGNNVPFAPLPSMYIDGAGELIGDAANWGMNTLLEHWAMAIHPPVLFIGYAGLTIPFAYALAALFVNDSSARWVERCSGIVLFAWLCLGLGIGLGAVWAYSVLGWGGYWAWDPVENVSLLPWLAGVALLHSFVMYRQRGALKRWSLVYACLAFVTVVFGTFVTRSGVVRSVHAFAGDQVSSILFLALIICSLAFGMLCIVFRGKRFKDEGAVGDFEGVFSKDVAYYLVNLIIVIVIVLLAYMTVSPNLPPWLPFGGRAVGQGAYDLIFRPLSILFLCLAAVCPLLSWHRTEGREFWRRARIPGLISLVMFVFLVIYFENHLLPNYAAELALGGSHADGVLEQGPSWYFNGLALFGLFTACLLFFNTLFMLGRRINRCVRAKDRTFFASLVDTVKKDLSFFGGCLSHLALSIILIGLIGSSMYTSEKTVYFAYDDEGTTSAKRLDVGEYALEYEGHAQEVFSDRHTSITTVTMRLYRLGDYIGDAQPKIEKNTMTQQSKSIAEIISLPLEDVFIVYQEIDTKTILVTASVNPLIGCVWWGFLLLMIGALLATLGRVCNRSKGKDSKFHEAASTSQPPGDRHAKGAE